MFKIQLFIYWKSANMQVKASQSNAKKTRKEGTLVHYVTSCTSESQHFFWENPFLKSTEHKPPSAGANVCWMHIIHSEVAPSVHTIASDSVSIFPRFVPPYRQRTPIGRKTSGSDPALSISVFYSTGWHFSFFPFSPCACVLLFKWCNEPMLCCRQRKGESLQQLKGPPHSSALLEHC